MSEDSKTLAVIVGLLVGALVLKKALAKPQPAAPPEGGAAGLELQLLDAAGNILRAQGFEDIAAISTWDFVSGPVEGGEYMLRAVVTNRSTRAGVPWAASLRVRHVVTAGGQTLKDLTQTPPFTAGEVKNVDAPFIVPVGMGGQLATATVNVLTPDGSRSLISKTQSFALGTADIIYIADVTIAAV